MPEHQILVLIIVGAMLIGALVLIGWLVFRLFYKNLRDLT
jgi:hypothetical protein